MEVEATLSSYRIFNAVARTGSLSKAAKLLYISQPAISKAVSRLEHKFSVRLFERKSRGVTLTPEGSLLYQYTRSAFTTLSLGEQVLMRPDDATSTRLAIGVTPSLCHSLLLPRLTAFLSHHESTTPAVDCYPNTMLEERLQTGDVPLSFQFQSDFHEDICFHEVFDLTYVLVATPAYADQYKDTPIKASFFFPEDFPSSLFSPKDTLRTQGVPEDNIHTLASMELAIEFARSGIGFCYVIKQFIEEDLKSSRLLPVPSVCASQDTWAGFAYLSQQDLPPIATEFLAFTEGGYHD